MKILIVGTGYVGTACAKQFLAANDQVLCRTLTAEHAADLRANGLLGVSGDCSQEEAWHNFRFKPDLVLYCPSTRGGNATDYRQVYVQGLEMTLRHVPQGVRFLYTSSTSVYGQDDGSWVDETSPVDPTTETSQILQEAEQRALNAGGVVLRLSAIYGPGRLVLRDRLLAGEAQMPSNMAALLNQVHVQDIANAVNVLAQSDVKGEVFNVSDDQPASYQEIYGWLCEKYGKPMPPDATEAHPGKRGGHANKRVSNKKLRALGWQPQFPSFREGYASISDGKAYAMA